MLKLILAFILLGVAASVPTQAQEAWQSRGTIMPVGADVCAPYRQGPVKTQRFAVYDQPAYLDPNAYRWTEIYFREVYQPRSLRGDGISFPGQRDLPNTASLFEIGLDGQPLPKPSWELWRAPDDLYFRLLVQGSAFQPTPERILGIYSNSRSHRVQAGHMENGFYIEKPTPFRRTGAIFFGFEQVVVPDGQSQDLEFFIHSNANGELTSVLYCSRIGAFPNPQCHLYEEIGLFEVSVDFRRTLMPQIEVITRHARAFVSCLTWKGSDQ